MYYGEVEQSKLINNRLVTDTQIETWNDKANANHTHNISDITNLQTTLDGKAAANHTHSYLPLAGGTMRGNLLFRDNDCIIGNSTDSLKCPTIYGFEVTSTNFYVIQDNNPIGGLISYFGPTESYLKLRFNINGSDNNYAEIVPDRSLSGKISLTLPTTSGTLALTSDIPDTSNFYTKQTYVNIDTDSINILRQSMPTYHTQYCGDGIYGYGDSSTPVSNIFGMNSGKITISGNRSVSLVQGEEDAKFYVNDVDSYLKTDNYIIDCVQSRLTISYRSSASESYTNDIELNYGKNGEINLYKSKKINLYDNDNTNQFNVQASYSGVNINTPNRYPTFNIKGSTWLERTQYQTNFYNDVFNIIGSKAEICNILRYDSSLTTDIKGIGLSFNCNIANNIIQIYYTQYKSLGSTTHLPLIYIDYTENSYYGYRPIFRMTRFTGLFVNTNDDTRVQVGSSCFEPVTGSGYNSDIALGRDTNKWSYVYATNGTIQTSNELKKIILDTGIDSRYEELYEKLEPIAFRWNNETADGSNHDRIHLGLGAQTTKKHMDEVGISAEEYALYCEDTIEETNEETGEVISITEYGINYGQLHALHIHMIQKLLKENEELKSRLSKLEELVSSNK